MKSWVLLLTCQKFGFWVLIVFKWVRICLTFLVGIKQRSSYLEAWLCHKESLLLKGYLEQGKRFHRVEWFNITLKEALSKLFNISSFDSIHVDDVLIEYNSYFYLFIQQLQENSGYLATWSWCLLDQIICWIYICSQYLSLPWMKVNLH